MAMATKPSSENATIVECTSLLVNSIVSDVEGIGAELYSAGFLSDGEREKLQLTGLGSEPSSKANRIVDAVGRKIKVNPRRFDDFINILTKQGSFMADCVQQVKEVYQKKLSDPHSGGPSFKCKCGGCTLKEFLKNGCPKAPKDKQVSGKIPQFPFLSISGLSETERDMLEVRLPH